jgi:hypothetical protein
MNDIGAGCLLRIQPNLVVGTSYITAINTGLNYAMWL